MKASATNPVMNEGKEMNLVINSDAIVLNEQNGASAMAYLTCLNSSQQLYYCMVRRMVAAPNDLPHNTMFLKPFRINNLII